MGFQISKFQLNEAKFLKYRPSQIAACSTILAINIYEKDLETQGQSTFFENLTNKGGLLDLNLKIWNTEQVHNLTGYSLDDIRSCLYDLSKYLANNLYPNRLEGFNI